jgi:hypothetical protein
LLAVAGRDQFADVRQGTARQVTKPSFGLPAGDRRRTSLQRRCQLLDFDVSQPYIMAMTKLLDEAVEAVRRLPSDDQDDIARAIMQLAGSDLPAPVVLSPEEREAIARSKAAADRGEFATDEQVRAVWAKHGL